MGFLPTLGHTVCMTLVNSSVCYDSLFTNMIGVAVLSVGGLWAGCALVSSR
jgi:hypothetical protein